MLLIESEVRNMKPFPFPNQYQNPAQYGSALNEYYHEQAAAHHYYEEQKKKKINRLIGQKDRIHGDPSSSKYSFLRRDPFLSAHQNVEPDQKPMIDYPKVGPTSTYTSSHESKEGWPKWVWAVIVIAIALILSYVL